jgi:hypothetical protein
VLQQSLFRSQCSATGLHFFDYFSGLLGNQTMNKTRFFIFLAFACVVGVMVAASQDSQASGNPHTEAWMQQFRSANDGYPDIYNGLFATTGACVNCHGSDPESIASTTQEGEDVNVVDDWRASMMANSARDPYWRAKMRQEMAAAPQHADETGHFCTQCHAPLGRHAHELAGLDLYTFDYMLSDTAGLDGISCVACHQQSTENLGNNHSGDLHFTTEPIAYGPFESPLASPMQLFSGYTPVHSDHISDAGICAGCHTLITQTTDLEGNYTGATFVEQATYHEWLNSIYGEDELNISCQSCHMPSLGMKQPIILAAGYDTPPRAPFSRHTFTGANAFMMGIMRDYRDTLQINATEEDYNAAIDATLNMLQQQSLALQANLVEHDNDSIKVELVLENLAGHKFPSGYPARRLFVQVTATALNSGEILFASGDFDNIGYLTQEDAIFEPHYDIIRNQNQVQIYEMVMSDVNGNPTTLLEQGAGYLKDNRLVPQGFSTSHAVYDTTQIAGEVLNDLNFNRDELGNEGTGIDRLRYHIPINGYQGAVQVDVNVWYQAVPPKWTEELFLVDDPLVAHFAEMYNAADKTPVLVRSTSLTNTNVGVENAASARMNLSVSMQGFVRLNSISGGQVMVFGLNGRMVAQHTVSPGNHQLQLNVPNGVYLVVFAGEDGKRIKKAYIN